MTKKKDVFLLIVEGPSDETILSTILDDIFDLNKIFYQVDYGDITTGNTDAIKGKSIDERVTNAIKLYIKKNRYGIKKEDIKKVIFLTDMDGCYLSDKYIFESDEKLKYTEEGIYTNNVNGILERNKTKSKNLNKISTASSVYRNIPIEVYYFSCNIDHAFFGMLNLSDSEKELYSNEFAEDMLDNVDRQMNILDSLSKHGYEYKDSWNSIKEGLNSVNRSSNLLVFLINNKEYLREDIAEKIDSCR